MNFPWANRPVTTRNRSRDINFALNTRNRSWVISCAMFSARFLRGFAGKLCLSIVYIFDDTYRIMMIRIFIIIIVLVIIIIVAIINNCNATQ